jgi:hypothetical protein
MTDHIQLGHLAPSEPANTSPAEALFEESTAVDVPAIAETSTPVSSVEPTHVVSNATLRDPVDITPTKPLSKLAYKISLPARPLRAFTSLLNEAAAANQQGVEVDSKREWREASEAMTEFYTPGMLYQERFEDPTSNFQQGLLQPDNSLLQFASPKFRKSDGELKGELALLKVSKALGQGDVLTIQLPHSGINVTVKPPGERAIINFYNAVFREKIALGRMTAGLTLTNFSVYINNRLFDFIIDHVHSVNYGDIPKTELRKYIKLPDFYMLATGLAAAMYPNGFEYQRPCVSADGKCNFVAEGLINLIKLHWVDNSALTDLQKQILSETRPGKLTIDHYTKYQMDHTRMVNKSFTLDNGMKFYLRTPTFDEYVTDGMQWVSKINASIDAIIVTDGDEEESRGQMLQQYVKSSTLRQFSHFVDYLEIDGSPITDRDTLNGALEILSADDDHREQIFKEILKYKSESVIAVIGIPEYKCPACHADQNTEPVNEGLVSVIPLDVMNLFFTLLTLRMSRILER